MLRNRNIPHSLAVILLILFGFSPEPLFAKPVPWEITADSLIHLKDPESILAEGNVILTRPKEQDPKAMVIRADWVRYDVERGTVKARGNVYVLSARDEIAARSADLDLEAKTGTFTDSTIFMAETHMFVRGDEVVKTGDFTYTLTNGWASACKTVEGERTPWSFRSSKTKLTVDGMAHLSNVRLQVKDVPVLYTPYLTFPAKTKRESGFLFPEWSHSSRDGFGITAPFFVNISPSQDVTLYPGYLSERGALYGAQYRYARGANSFGTFMLSFLRDDLLDGADLDDEFKTDGLIRRANNRYWLRGKADHDFGDDLTARLDLDLVSDQDYMQEFEGGALGYTASNDLFLDDFRRDLQEKTLTERESALQLTKAWANMVLSGEVRTRQNAAHDLRLTTDDGDGVLESGEYVFRNRSTSPLQALPRFGFSGRMPIGDSGVSGAWGTEYVNYWREEGLGAQRMDLHPQLITSLPRGGWVEGKVTGGVRETVYQIENYGESDWEYDRFQDRQAFDFTGNMATTLIREFDFGAGEADWLEHMIRPNLLYEYVTRTEEQRLPLLDTVDNLERENWLTWQLNNYFGMGGTREDGELWNRDFALFKVLQTYDFRAENPETMRVAADARRYDWSDLRFDFELYPLERWKVRYQTNVSMYGKGVTRYQLLSSYALRAGHSFSLDYRYLEDSTMKAPYFYTDLGESVHDLTGRIKARLTETLLATAALNKSFSANHTVESSVGLAYMPHCWMVEVEAVRSVGDQRIMIIFSLDGIGRAFRWGKGNV
ncbi:LPS-assembly protein LptD [Thiovibrio sp. JS02]